MRVEVVAVEQLRFDDGSPVRAASAMARLGDGWLVAQDDSSHAAWVRPSSVAPVRVFPPVEGLDLFSEADGTKHLKPDVEAACEVRLADAHAVILLGSGSTTGRMRGSLVELDANGPGSSVSSLEGLYGRVAQVLEIGLDDLNLEGACLVGDRLRWFSRGNLAAGLPSASVDLDLQGLLSAMRGTLDPAAVSVSSPLRYDLGEVDGVGLAVTDAVALPDGRVLLSAAAEDTPDAVADGPVVASAIVVVGRDELVAVARLPRSGVRVHKIEGLGLLAVQPDRVRLLAVVDADDPELASSRLELEVDWS